MIGLVIIHYAHFQPRTSHKPDIALLSASIYIKSLLSALGDSDPENRIHSHHCSIMHTPKGLLPSNTRLRPTRKGTYLRSTRKATKPTLTALILRTTLSELGFLPLRKSAVHTHTDMPVRVLPLVVQ